MRYSEIINEVFNTDVPGSVVKATNGLFVTRATIGNRDIKFTAAGDAGDWEIDFVEKSPTRGDTFSKSGSGNELQVFSFVIESLKLFISKYAPNSIMFTSDKSDTNRSSLYARMAKRIKIPGYSVQVDSKSGGYDIFRILKDK